MNLKGKLMQMRNICIVEPKTNEFFQMSYLCDEECGGEVEEALERKYKSLHQMASERDKEFMKLGIYPVSLHYERNGRVRARENSMSGFRLECENRYRLEEKGISILKKMKCLQKQVQEQAA